MTLLLMRTAPTELLRQSLTGASTIAIDLSRVEGLALELSSDVTLCHPMIIHSAAALDSLAAGVTRKFNPNTR